MPRRLLEPTNADRLIPLVFGVYFLYAAAWLHISAIDAADDTVPVFFDELWQWVFAAAGVLAVAYAVKPASQHFAAWSGGVMILALLSRGASIFVAWVNDAEAISTARAFLGLGTWTVLGYAVGIIWTRVLGPLGRRRRET